MAKTISGRFWNDRSKLSSKSIINLAPGPGSYRVFSEFGQYESKFANEMDKSMRKTAQNSKRNIQSDPY